MDGPRCIRRGCENPVKQARYGAEPKRGWRVIDGIRWNWTCSNVCKGYDNQQFISNTGRANGYRAYREQVVQRRVQELLNELRPLTDNRGLVNGQHVAELLLKAERRAYKRGYNSGLIRARRQPLKETA